MDDKIDPGDTLIYGLDWTRRLWPGDSVSDSRWTFDSASSSGDNQQTLVADRGFSNNITSVQIKGGSPGVVYFWANTITTALGDIRVERIAVECERK